MLGTILGIVSKGLSVANKLIPSQEFIAGKKVMAAEQLETKARLDRIYDEIVSRNITPSAAISSLRKRAREFYKSE